MKKRAGIKKYIGSIIASEDGQDLDFMRSYTKYIAMQANVVRFAKILKMLGASAMIDKFAGCKENLVAYNKLIDDEIAKTFTMDSEALKSIKEKHPIVSSEDNETIKAFLASYNAMKNSTLINTILGVCSNLIIYKTHISNIDKLDDYFITKSSTSDISPIPDLNLNFKLMYIQGDALDDTDRRFILLVLHKLYTTSHDLYTEYGKADIDTDKFVKVVEQMIGELKRKIPRCNDAFTKILESTELLRDNYDTYYKDYICSKNTSIIAENFVLDVSKTIDPSPRLMFQFKEILRELRKMVHMSSGISGSHKKMINALTKDLNSNFKLVQKLEEEGLDALDDEEEDEEDEEEDLHTMI